MMFDVNQIIIIRKQTKSLDLVCFFCVIHPDPMDIVSLINIVVPAEISNIILYLLKLFPI